MPSPKVGSNRGAVQVAFSLAHLLEHIEHSGGPISAHQYQKVALALKAALSDSLPEAAMATLLEKYPAAAEIHESMNYETAGLSRASLESNVSSEVLALRALQRASLRRR